MSRPSRPLSPADLDVLLRLADSAGLTRPQLGSHASMYPRLRRLMGLGLVERELPEQKPTHRAPWEPKPPGRRPYVYHPTRRGQRVAWHWRELQQLMLPQGVCP